jgi:hypothetical protein
VNGLDQPFLLQAFQGHANRHLAHAQPRGKVAVADDLRLPEFACGNQAKDVPIRPVRHLNRRPAFSCASFALQTHE